MWDKVYIIFLGPQILHPNMDHPHDHISLSLETYIYMISLCVEKSNQHERFK